MDLKSEKTCAKEKIFQAASELVKSEEEVESITTRQIAMKAGVNLALINYHYNTKDNLLSQVVMSMMENLIDQISDTKDERLDPALRLKKLFHTTANFAFKHHKLYKLIVRIDIQQGCASSSAMIMPVLREIFHHKNQSDLDIIALQLLLPLQNIVAYPELYNSVLNTDIFNDEFRKDKVNQIIDSILNMR